MVILTRTGSAGGATGPVWAVVASHIPKQRKTLNILMKVAIPAASAVLVVAAVLMNETAGSTPAKTDKVTTAPVVTCDPAPAACGEVSWVAGLDKYLADQAAFFAAIEASKSSGSRSSGGGGRYPRGCVGGESACIPTTPGTCVLPAYICARESSAINKWNYQGSGASGKYQAMPGTWGGYAGYQYAALAPESVQDQWAAELWNNGAGCSHWSAC